MSPGDLLFLYTDGVYDGSDEEERSQFERVIREHKNQTAREILNAILRYAVKKDEILQLIPRRRPHRRQDGLYRQAQVGDWRLISSPSEFGKQDDP